MLKLENNCVNCGLHCLGKDCKNVDVPTHYCDYCNKQVLAEYKIEEDDFCKKCANDYLQNLFNDLTIQDRAKVLELTLKKY